MPSLLVLCAEGWGEMEWMKVFPSRKTIARSRAVPAARKMLLCERNPRIPAKATCVLYVTYALLICLNCRTNSSAKNLRLLCLSGDFGQFLRQDGLIIDQHIPALGARGSPDVSGAMAQQMAAEIIVPAGWIRQHITFAVGSLSSFGVGGLSPWLQSKATAIFRFFFQEITGATAASQKVHPPFRRL